MIVIIDYDVGNIGSIQNMLYSLNLPAIVTSNPEVIAKAERLILPGVGSFDNGIRNLRRLGLIEALNQKVTRERTPILGICLGAQLMLQASEEGQEPGLGWIKGRAVRFFSQNTVPGYRVPHMGWASVTPTRNSGLFLQMPQDSRFYFVHSYHFNCDDPADVLAETTYGYKFASAFSSDNCFGVQFHPEKSHKFGKALFRAFASMPLPIAQGKREGIL